MAEKVVAVERSGQKDSRRAMRGLLPGPTPTYPSGTRERAEPRAGHAR